MRCGKGGESKVRKGCRENVSWTHALSFFLDSRQTQTFTFPDTIIIYASCSRKITPICHLVGEGCWIIIFKS